MNRYKYLIDTSYLIYYSSFSSFNTYVWQEDIYKSQMNQDFDPTIDQQFCKIFQKRIIKNIMTPLTQIFPIIDKSEIYFCLDCARKNIWRKQIFPEYKISRDNNKPIQQKKFNISKMFNYAYNFIIPKLCEEYGAKKIFSNFAEGDDIIAILNKKYLEQDENLNIIILSGDKDMVQLCNDRTEIITINGVKRTPKQQLESALKKKLKDNVTAKDFLLFKILIGDNSDDIPNIKAGIGPKRAYQLIKDKQKLKSILKEDKLVMESFIRNKKLISMKQIPLQISNMILESVKDNEKTNTENQIIF